MADLDDWLDYDPGDPDHKRRARQSDLDQKAAYEAGRSEGSSSSSTTNTVSIPAASRKIVGLMGLTVIFSVIGQEVKKAQGGKVASTGTLSGPAKTILGGTIAAALLSFAAEAGPTGQQFGVGVASIAAVTAVFINGGPVWKAISNVVGSTKATGSTGTGQATTPTPLGPTSLAPGYQSIENLPTIVGNQNVVPISTGQTGG